jgi:8-amino-7-oxononanoate synthase
MKNPYLIISDKTTALTPERNSLLDLRKANRSFNEINALVEKNQYSFQPEYQERKGAIARVLGKEYFVFSSYDYLGLIGHDVINTAAKQAIDEFGTGTGGVRLLTGTNSLHRKLERDLAEFKGKEDAITFTSGYMANIAITTALIGKVGKVYADEKIHRSFMDALKLAGSDYVLFPHNDHQALKTMLAKDASVKRKFIVSEGVFSMDGDLCPLPELIALKKEHKAFLIIDEAHSFGVLGDNGRGIDEHYGIDPGEIDVVSGSLSKTIPANGGFILSNSAVIVFLQHECAPYIFSGSLCPPAASAAISALRIISEESWRLRELQTKVSALRSIIQLNGFKTSFGSSPVIPVLTGDYELTFKLYKFLHEKGILVCPVIFPAVPVNESIIRLCASVYHTDEMYEYFAKVLKEFNKGL